MMKPRLRVALAAAGALLAAGCETVSPPGKLARWKTLMNSGSTAVIAAEKVSCNETDASDECIQEWALHGQAVAAEVQKRAAVMSVGSQHVGAMCPPSSEKSRLTQAASELALGARSFAGAEAQLQAVRRGDRALMLYCLANLSEIDDHRTTIAAADELTEAVAIFSSAAEDSHMRRLAAAIADHAARISECTKARAVASAFNLSSATIASCQAS